MILFIHGFGSSGHSFKANLVREYFKEKDDVLSPTLSYIPKLAIDTLKQIIELFLKRDEKINLIGSSLGGFYSIYLSELYDLKAVLINPAVNATQTLKKAIPQGITYFDESHFEWRESHIEMLKNYDITPKNQKRFLLMIQKGDEVLNYKEALKKLPKAHLILEEGGSHHFDGFSKYLERIEKFFKNGRE